MTLKFDRVLAVDDVHVRVCAKFHPVECSGSWLIVVTETLPRCWKQCCRRHHGQ